MMKTVFRKATLRDVDAIVSIGVESVSKDPLPLRIDKGAMAEMIADGMGPAHFLWVAEQDGEVVAAMGAYVQRGFWFERLQCSVLLYYSRVPGAGLPLIRQFVKWLKSRPAIKMAIIELEPGVDPRLVKFMKRAGFARESMNLTYVRGAS